MFHVGILEILYSSIITTAAYGIGKYEGFTYDKGLPLCNIGELGVGNNPLNTLLLIIALEIFIKFRIQDEYGKNIITIPYYTHI
jgi:hypothetical protein